MADGDNVDAKLLRDTDTTSSATPVALITYTPPNKTGLLNVMAWVGAMDAGAGTPMYGKSVHGVARVNAGSAAAIQVADGPESDPDTTGWDATLDVSGGSVRLMITGDTSTVRWHGRMHVDFTEEAYSPV